MMESRRVSPRGCVKFVSCVRDLAEEFQGGGVRGSKGGECRCKELVAGGFYIGCMFVNFYAFISCHDFWVGTRKDVEGDAVIC